MEKLLNCALAIRNTKDFLTIALPNIPEPGVFPDKTTDTELRAASELAIFSSGWTMLHEVRHIKHQQDGTSSTDENKEAKHKEELSCDMIATKFILERISEYSACYNEDQKLIERKRKLGVYFALFALTVLSKDKWEETETHPSMQERIDAICKEMNGDETDDSWVIAVCAFSALRKVWANAPQLHSSTLQV